MLEAVEHTRGGIGVLESILCRRQGQLQSCSFAAGDLGEDLLAPLLHPLGDALELGAGSARIVSGRFGSRQVSVVSAAPEEGAGRFEQLGGPSTIAFDCGVLLEYLAGSGLLPEAVELCVRCYGAIDLVLRRGKCFFQGPSLGSFRLFETSEVLLKLTVLGCAPDRPLLLGNLPLRLGSPRVATLEMGHSHVVVRQIVLESHAVEVDLVAPLGVAFPGGAAHPIQDTAPVFSIQRLHALAVAVLVVGEDG